MERSSDLQKQIEGMLLSIPPMFDETVLAKMNGLLAGVKNVMVCAHRSPDGDAVGSALAWASYLRQLGKWVRVILPNPFPDFLTWLPQSHTVQFYEKHPITSGEVIRSAEAVFCLDFSTTGRTGAMWDDIEKTSGKIAVIDHHLAPDIKDAQIMISHPEMSSTCEIVFRLIIALGGYGKMDKAAATGLYTGMMTDTGGFTYNSNRPEIFQLIGLLLAKGIDKDKIYRNVFNNYSVYRIKFTGYVLNYKLNFYNGNKASVFTITREEMKRFHFIRGDAEGLVNMPLQVKGMRLSISLREDTEKDVIRVSLRSVDDFPCNEMAEKFFNGGGHLNASGGELPFPMEEAVKTAERAINAFSDRL